jgi:drug/metabolite transporter (DMT)-like permease
MIQRKIGFFLLLLWCIVSAVAYIFIGKTANFIGTILLCFGLFSLSFIFFFILNFIKLKSLFYQCQKQKKNLLLVNITTFLTWFLTLYPLKFIEPAIVNALVLTTLPIATLGILWKTQKNIQSILSAVFLFLGIVFLFVILKEKKSGLQLFSADVIISFLCCLGAGIFLAINNIFTKKLSIAGFSPIDILTSRFILMIIITGLLSIPQIKILLLPDVFGKILLISLSLIIIPQTIFQYALKNTDPFSIAVVSSLKPVVVFFLEIFNTELALSFWTILGVSYLALVSILSSIFQYKRSS